MKSFRNVFSDSIKKIKLQNSSINFSKDFFKDLQYFFQSFQYNSSRDMKFLSGFLQQFFMRCLYEFVLSKMSLEFVTDIHHYSDIQKEAVEKLLLLPLEIPRRNWWKFSKKIIPPQFFEKKNHDKRLEELWKQFERKTIRQISKGIPGEIRGRISEGISWTMSAKIPSKLQTDKGNGEFLGIIFKKICVILGDFSEGILRRISYTNFHRH